MRMGDRILGGEKADSGELPWMAALGYLNHRLVRITYDCGGKFLNLLYNMGKLEKYDIFCPSEMLLFLC